MYIKLIKFPKGYTWCKSDKGANYDYEVRDNYRMFYPGRNRNYIIENTGRYEAWTLIHTESRKREVIVSIGFDSDGNFQSFAINYDEGTFSDNEMEYLFDTLTDWLVKDGWAKKSNYPINHNDLYHGHRLDELVDDPDPKIRRIVAKNGYGLDVLINDPDYLVRAKVADQGYGLDVLINDPDEHVRGRVAKQGYGLDKLINDPSSVVRWYVASKGYRLDKLITDPDLGVRRKVKDKLIEVIDAIIEQPEKKKEEA